MHNVKALLSGLKKKGRVLSTSERNNRAAEQYIHPRAKPPPVQYPASYKTVPGTEAESPTSVRPPQTKAQH